ncbi:MAG: gephyrin-like molybdotransferase Glp [Candidatus Marinimicrobia bacterium]|mgnify:CR=1 FL=1|nr:gephyrin-like molybdotransferase Glp [Candidatus Neomarinimicrobiota bacterium]
MIPFKDAKTIIEKHLFKLGFESVPLSDAGNRILAQDIVATFPSPQFDNSAMDGFAVRYEDLKGASKENPVTLKLVGISSAGSPSEETLGPSECTQCMTGAKIPHGANTIVMVEDSSGFSDLKSVQIFLEIPPGKHIRKKGEEIKKGEVLISKGTPITPSEIGTCATFGYGKLSVAKKPKIAIFGTGDELIEPGNKPKLGEIYNSNLYVFAELAERVGAEVIMRNVIKDDRDALHSFLSEALETCDIVISSGGVSMGRFDYVREVFMALGVTEHFWKVAQKPGKPLFFGTGDSTLIFGLPGNPVSSYIGFMEWVWPVLETMMGKPETKKLTGILKKPFPREKVKYRFLFGNAWMEDGKLVCKPSTKVGSHMLSSSLGANCILSSDSGESPLQKGGNIDMEMLPWKSLK